MCENVIAIKNILKNAPQKSSTMRKKSEYKSQYTWKR